MSFPKIEAELAELKKDINEINESIKQLVIQMKLINITFESTLKPKQRREYIPLEIRFPEKINPRSDDEKYIKRYQEKLLKTEQEALQKIAEEQRKFKEKDSSELVSKKEYGL